jgi:hypothetical protein
MKSPLRKGFTTEKETLDYVKRSKFKKNVKWKVEEFDSKYFRGGK